MSTLRPAPRPRQGLRSRVSCRNDRSSADVVGAERTDDRLLPGRGPSWAVGALWGPHAGGAPSGGAFSVPHHRVGT